MPQRHLDRLNAVDAAFLHQERGNAHMHIGGIAVFAGGPPSFDDLLGHINARLPLVPRYRQKLAFPPLESGHPVWIDDADFNLEYHVRNTALPSPGGEEELLRLAGRIVSQRLDRTKPLWEMWLVEGLEGGRHALISKTHHCLVDGVSGMELLTVLFDLTPDYAPGGVVESWTPHRPPDRLGLIAAGLRDRVVGAVGAAGGVAGAVVDPRRGARRLAEAVQGLGEVAWAAVNPAPPTPLNTPIGPHRRFDVLRGRLEDYKAIKNAFGGTVNDVVLTVVAGGLASFLRTRGLRTEGLQVRACVPVSVRGSDESHALGNRITVMLAPLPVYIEDPVERLEVVREAMQGLKESKQALGAQVISQMEDFAPPTILAQASRLNFSSRMYNLLVTNVPGPQFPVYMLGRELTEVFPIAFLAEDKAVAVAIVSYNGGINFGLLADYDSVPDLQVLTRAICAALDELLGLARSRATSAAEAVAVAAGTPSGDGARPSRRSAGTGGRRTGTAKGTRRRARGDAGT